MKFLIRIIVVLFFISFSESAFADKHDLRDILLHGVYINSGGMMLIRVEGLGYLSLGQVGNKTAEMMYATALAAKISQQSVWIRYWDTEEQYPSVGIICVNQ
ncbi:hypothetical protein JCM14469_06340 [Desulfatiferula olefinivorans]